ncbi:MAG: DUF4124 domain-containing protein [Gammaproteobacteria bacterium]|nr:DUF4124 domain-containing protein [Gammaproteobacteria bacterium]
MSMLRNCLRFGLVSVLLLSLTPTVLHAQIYRWVDTQGNVHFSDIEPNKTVKAERITPNIKTPAAQPDEGELRRQKYLSLADEKQPEPSAIEASTWNSQDCTIAQVRLGILELGMPIYWTQSGDLRPYWRNDIYQGSRAYVSDEDRPALLQQTQRDQNRYCASDSGPQDSVDAYNDWVDSEYCAVARVALDTAQKKQSRTAQNHIDKILADIELYCVP